MTGPVEWTQSAQRDWRGIPDAEQVRILDAVNRLGQTGHGDVRALKGRPGFRLRVGSWRVLFAYYNSTIMVLRVLRRNERTYGE